MNCSCLFCLIEVLVLGSVRLALLSDVLSLMQMQTRF